MAFHNIRLPVDVEKGAQGGPEFKTTVLALSSGFEKRNIDWARARGTWDVSYGLDKKTNLEAVLTFFYARQGMAHSFRFKDWTDFEIGKDSTDTEQDIAIADGVLSNFQAVRRYTSGSETFDREVTRLVAGTPRVFVNTVEQGAGFTVDIDTGVINFTSPPASSAVIGLIAEFDVPVRFDNDHLPLQAIREDVFSMPQVNVVELREVLTVLT